MNQKYSESEIPNPLSYYGQTKLNAEKIILDGGNRNVILRTTVIYGQHERSRFTNWVIENLKNNIPDRNADVVQKYIDAGAIILGKTNTPLASGDFQSFNDIYGTTNNPWDITRTCGGSSGGAAAALASGMTPLELGGDIGGSIRIPSHLNGVYGHKPSHGIVSQRSLVDWPEQISEQDLWVVGPMGICARDIRDALRILCLLYTSPSPRDGLLSRMPSSA